MPQNERPVIQSVYLSELPESARWLEKPWRPAPPRAGSSIATPVEAPPRDSPVIAFAEIVLNIVLYAAGIGIVLALLPWALAGS